MEEPITVQYVVYESSMARAERQIKRLWISLIISIVMIVLTNIAWLYVWNSYEYVGDTSEISVEGQRDANYIGNDGDITNGESGGEEVNQIPQEEER